MERAGREIRGRGEEGREEARERGGDGGAWRCDECQVKKGKRKRRINGKK